MSQHSNPTALLLILIALATASSAHAQTQAQTPPTASAPISLAAVEAKLAADGFQIIEIERYATTFEVKGRDKAGACVELNLDARTGAVVRRERDDSCDRRGRDDRGRRDHD